MGAARRLSTRNPADIVVEEDGMRASHRTVTEQVGPAQPLISIRVEPAPSVPPVVWWIAPPSHKINASAMVPDSAGAYEAHLPDLGKGKRMRYWITVSGEDGSTVRVPEDAGSSVLIKFKGAISRQVLGAHIAFMFASFFFMVMSLFSAIGILKGAEEKKAAVRLARWVLFCSFVGGWPLGFLLNYQAFGPIWEGFPFGYDITDNKTQVMFVFWLVSLLLVRGSFMGRGEEKDRLGPRAFAWAVIASFIVSLALFIVPHSM
jgi:hypothetical protein